jgi:hypothetical protein
MKKQKAEILGCIFTIILLVNACSPNLAANEEGVSLLAHQEALRRMYGKDLNISSNDGTSILSPEGVKYDIEMNVFSCYWNAFNVETCLVVTDRSQCMGCGSYIDAAIFNRMDGEWKLQSYQSSIVNFDSSGKAPKGEIVEIGDENYAVQFRWRYSSTGSTLEHLVLIGNTGATTAYSFGVLLDIVSMGERWIAADKKEGWSTNLYIQRTEEKKEYDDLIVNYYGDNNEMPYSEFYTFSDEKYTLSFKKSY